MPFTVPGFSDVSVAHINHNHLFFLEEWKIVALRPYVRDLRESVKKGYDPFLPLHNNVGWQQYFEDHPPGAQLFQQLIRNLRQLSKSQDYRRFAEELPRKYDILVEWLEKLLECLIRLEEWLQHLKYASRLICGLGEKPTLARPTPSLFNVYNLRAAFNMRLLEDELPSSSASNAVENTPTVPLWHVYDAVRDSLLEQLVRNSPDPENSKEKLETLETVLSAIQRFGNSIDSLDQILEGESLPPKDAEDFMQNVSDTQKEIKQRFEDLQGFLDEGKSANLKKLLEDFRILDPSDARLLPGDLGETLNRTRVSVDPMRIFAERETEEAIQTFCRQRARAMRESLLGEAVSDIEDVVIEQALWGGLPELGFEAALEKGVLADLESICHTLGDAKLQDREGEYELIREEDEVRRIGKVVQGILGGDRSLEDRYGVTCRLLELSEKEQGESIRHDEPDDTICKTARALAAATMYSNSFDRIDETRLVYIASHIVKVLDNHLVYQAQQRGLELDYDALDVLGLEHFGLGLLDTLHSCAQRIASTVRYLHERETFHTGDSIPRLQTRFLPLKELIQAIANCSNGKARSEEQEWLVCRLATVPSPSLEASECILKQIYQRGARLGLEMEPIRKADESFSQITFLPTKGIGQNNDELLSHSVLRLKKRDKRQRQETQGVELLIHFRSMALCDRDPHALWSAVNVLEDTLEVVEATAGGVVCYN
jgi:hypothetical protein